MQDLSLLGPEVDGCEGSEGDESSLANIGDSRHFVRDLVVLTRKKDR